MYRLKHKPTGLYYKPFIGLTNKGKVYQTKGNLLTYSRGENVSISLDLTRKILKPHFDYFKLKRNNAYYSTYTLPKSDFEIEFINTLNK